MNRRFDFYSKEQSNTLLAQLKARRKQDFEYLVIDGEEHLEQWVAEIERNSSFIALDTETKGLTPAPGVVKTLQLAYSEELPVLIVYLDRIEDKNSLRRLLGNSKLLKVGHHLKFDILMLEAEGIKVKPPMMCTMLGIEVL
ncbi:MAG: hypothetical protein ACRDBG_26510, partial [Waterburya sp.]